ncbi:hypothetical protein ABZ215_24865 [Amycolatopsis sp. NPDC006131]|uniref:hypothetical protein n=1 Tax=Amycolatopsis sp. NPDC006131 TaxID=3156731 RepID=UPI0033B03D25
MNDLGAVFDEPQEEQFAILSNENDPDMAAIEYCNSLEDAVRSAARHYQGEQRRIVRRVVTYGQWETVERGRGCVT